MDRLKYWIIPTKKKKSKAMMGNHVTPVYPV